MQRRTNRQMEEWADRWKGEWRNRRTERWTDRDRQMDKRTERRKDGQKDEWENLFAVGQMDGKKEEHIYDLTDRQILRLEDFVRGGGVTEKHQSHRN